MPLLTLDQTRLRTLTTIPLADLRLLAQDHDRDPRGTAMQLIDRLVQSDLPLDRINQFIKRRFAAKVAERERRISTADLQAELAKLDTFTWGAVQGQHGRTYRAIAKVLIIAR